MQIDPLSLLVGFLGGTGLLGVAWGYATRNPEKVLQVLAIVYHFFARWFREADRRYVAANIEAHVGATLKELDREAPGVVPHGLKINWVATTTPEAFVEQGNVVVRLNYHGDQDRNLVHAIMTYVPKGILPEARHYLEEDLEQSIDLTMAKRILSREGTSSSMNYFFEEYLIPAIKANPELSELCTSLDRLNERGWLTRILLAEFFELGTVLFPKTPSGAEAEETVRFFRFLDRVARREHGEEVNLTFTGRYLRMSIVFVARAQVREAHGTWPHFAWIKKLTKRDIHRIYVNAIGGNIGPTKGLARRAAEQLPLQIGRIHEYRGRFFGRRRTKAICVVLGAKPLESDSENEAILKQEESEPPSAT